MALDDGLRRFARWFWTASVPLWAERAADRDGSFYESLDFSGAPNEDEPRRVRVLARQAHVFAQIAKAERHPAAEGLARRGFAFLAARACPLEGERGCVHLLAPDGTVLDDRRDLYDQAFVLLACASHFEAFGDEAALELAARVIAFLDREMKAAIGFHEDDRRTLPRRQNPHMHLFEAFLALYAATDEPEYLQRAVALHAVFQARFLDWPNGVLQEYFDDDLYPLADERGAVLEPGHMVEWVWLLERYGRMSGAEVGQTQRLLYDRAIEIGADASGFLVDEALIGKPAGGPRRLWPQTEYLKASLVMARRGDAAAGRRAAALIDALFATYLAEPVAGLWCDQFGPDGGRLASAVPASILYHLYEAASEAERAIAGPAP